MGHVITGHRLYENPGVHKRHRAKCIADYKDGQHVNTGKLVSH